ncbi:putative Zn-binding protein involved in type VI secretion [Bradyrhizobium elkanii]
MHTNHHHIDGVEIAFVGAATVSLVAFIASMAWLLIG